MTVRTLFLLALGACTQPKMPQFTMPRNVEDVRGRLLPYLEGLPTADARAWMQTNGFVCDAPMESAVDAHANVCRAVVRDAGWSGWSVVLLDRKGRVADVQAR